MKGKILAWIIISIVFSFNISKAELPFAQSVKIISKKESRIKTLANSSLFKQLYMNGYLEPVTVTEKTGSGVLISDKGEIVTNFHVIQDSSKLEVVSSSGVSHAAKVLVGDSSIDLALIKAPTMAGTTPVPIRKKSPVTVGQKIFVLASPFGIINSYTEGRVSGLHRSFGFTKYEDSIQTDASINPGASGGGVYSKEKHLVGIASGIISSDQGFQGIGVVIPFYIVRAFIRSALTHNKSVHTDYGFTLKSESSKSLCFVRIVEIEDGAYAASIGFRKNDKVIRLNESKTCSKQELIIKSTFLSSTEVLSYLVIRKSKQIELTSNPITALMWSLNYVDSTNQVPRLE
jgi:S1-C subfamily serine protease